jgi:hypothetical protein
MTKRKKIPQAVRDKLLVDAMHRCCLCPEHHDVTDIHHIVPISADGPNSEDNLMVVCPTCHAKIHRIRNRYSDEQLRMCKERWVRLCALGLPLDVRMTMAVDYTRPLDLDREDEIEGACLPSSASAASEASVLNPFCDRGRINYAPRFFNRRRILRELGQMLAAGNSVSLVGESEIGKSSVLYRLYQTRTEWLADARVLYFDLQGMLDEDDFCAELLEDLEEAPVDCSADPRKRMRALKRALRPGRVVLLLDEVEKLADVTFSTNLHQVLRAMAQGTALTLGVASHRPLVEVFPPREPTSPFHNIFTEKRLGPFTPEDAREFVSLRLEGTGVAFTREEVERLVSDSDCHPAHLQRLAYELFERKRR